MMMNLKYLSIITRGTLHAHLSDINPMSLKASLGLLALPTLAPNLLDTKL
jgi:hypothetical protein